MIPPYENEISTSKRIPAGGYKFYKFPRRSCSLSIDSNNALKFPSPNPRDPLR